MGGIRKRSWNINTRKTNTFETFFISFTSNRSQ